MFQVSLSHYYYHHYFTSPWLCLPPLNHCAGESEIVLLQPGVQQEPAVRLMEAGAIAEESPLVLRLRK